MPGKKHVLALIFAVVLSGVCFPQAVIPGHVTISYSFYHLLRIASNQYAIWIEDDKGNFVKTLFATNFVAKRAGWKARPQTVPTWLKAANIQSLSKKEIDAISGPTPGDGAHIVVWDLRDATGKLVPSGTYVYFIESNIYWEKRVLWSGKISVGDKPISSQAEPVYIPADAKTTRIPISKVTAEYAPDK